MSNSPQNLAVINPLSSAMSARKKAMRLGIAVASHSSGPSLEGAGSNRPHHDERVRSFAWT